MNELTLYNKTDGNIVEDDIIKLQDSKYHIIELDVRLDEKSTNKYDIDYDKTNNTWVKIRKVNSSIYLYISNNYTTEERYFYFEIKSYETCVNPSITLIQKACNYNIDIVNNIPKGIYNINDEIEYTITIKGGRKIPLIEKNTLSLIDNENNYIPYDNSLYYQLIKTEETTDFNVYQLKVKILGDFDNRQDYTYKIPVIHADNLKLVETISIAISDNSEDNSELNNTIISIDESINKTQSEIIQRTNYDNKNNKKPNISALSAKRSKTLSILNDVEEEIITYTEGLELLSSNIVNNKIILDIKTAPDYDSLLIIYPRVDWIKYDTVLIKDKYKNEGIHKVTIYCDTNHWSNPRRGYVSITNAENQNKRLAYLITQEKDGSISFK